VSRLLYRSRSRLISAPAAAAVEWLRASQEPLRVVLQESDEDDLGDPKLTNWGDRWPCERIWRTIIDEQVHHVKAVGYGARPVGATSYPELTGGAH
jgi:hypothetical protein